MPQLDHLSTIELRFVYALALFGAPLSQNALLDLMLMRRENIAPAGRLPNALHVREFMTALHEKSMVEHVSGRGYALRSEIRFAAILHLLTHDDVLAWVDSLRGLLAKNRDYDNWKTRSASFCQREMLFSALIQESEGFLKWYEDFCEAPSHPPALAWEMFQDEAGQQVFSRFTPSCQGVLLRDFLIHANWHLDEAKAIYDYAVGYLPTRSSALNFVFAELAWQALFRGDDAVLAQLAHVCPAHFMAQYQLIRGLEKHHFPMMLEACDEILLARKKATGKRKVYLSKAEGLAHTIALLGLRQAEHLKQLIEHAENALKRHDAFSYVLLMPLLQHLAKGVPIQAIPYYLQKDLSLDSLFEALATDWVGDPPQTKQHARFQLALDRYIHHGYHWLAAEMDAILVHHYGDTPRRPNWHAQRERRALFQILAKEEAWQRALLALAQLPLHKTANATTSTQEQRLVWLLSEWRGQYALEAREQKRSAKGLWSKGRPVALKRLVTEENDFPYLLAQDKQIIQCISKHTEGYYGHTEYQLDTDAALIHLVQHPHVMWADAPEVTLDIQQGEVCLHLKEESEHIHLKLEPEVLGNTSYVLARETPTRLRIYRNSAELKQISAILGTGLAVPLQAKAQLVDVITAIAPHLNIHSDLPELAQHLISVEADPCLYVHLLPLKEGLRLQILVRPLAEGSWLAPGRGAAHVLGERDHKAVQASRDLAQETARVEQLLKQCPSFTELDMHHQEWQCQEPQLCLELLSQLKDYAEQINQGGEQIQLIWPEGERFRLKGKRSVADLRLQIKKQGEWFIADGEIALDDGRVLALRELLQLSEQSQSRFLRLGEQDFLALNERFQKQLEELRRYAEVDAKNQIRINPLAADTLTELANEAGSLQADKAWQAHQQKIESLANFVPALPTTLQAQLRDYQIEGYQWLARMAHWGVGACLADDMGLGKTLQTIALLLARASNGPALVIAPTSVVMNWQSEIQRFAPTLQVRLYQEQRSLAELGAFDVLITSYGLLQQDKASFSTPHWHSIVLDEAQVIKNAATKRSQAAMALQGDFKMIASGTPVENHLGELWNLFRFINPSLLGSHEQFHQRFAVPIEKGDKQAKAHLKKLLQAFILRRTKAQVLSELPARTEINLQVELSDEERHLYEALRQEALEKIAHSDPSSGLSMQVLAEITRLRRFCCHPSLTLKHSKIEGSKLAVLQETVNELLDNRHKALVFSQFVDHLAIVRTWLDQAGITYQYLDGSTSAHERKKRVEAFQAGEGDIFLISLKAGGTGLNLTAADYVIHLDPWWNPAVEDQASDRAHRMGQQRPVTIYRLVTQNTIEEKILALHAEKRELADSLLEGGDRAGRLDTEALLHLLRQI